MTSSESTESPSVRIVLRPVGSPLTIAMAGLAIASLLDSGLALGWVSARETAYVGLILIAVPSVLQLIACLFAYLARDGATGACSGVLATTWLAIGLVHALAGGDGRSAALGLLLVAVAGVLAFSGVAVSIVNPLPGGVFLLSATRFTLDGVYGLGGGGGFERAAAMIGLLVTAAAIYSVLAFELEGQQRRPVLPTFRRGRAKAARGEPADGQLRGISREPGVREIS
ncbi:MAG: hypothetical protein ACYCUM_02265 [Solirubrobacteraceae bacterium]